jgi:glycosyltransferase involved in cell wall biosynthesis
MKIPVAVSIQGNLTVYNHKFYSGFLGKYLHRVKSVSPKDILVGPHYFKKGKNTLSKMALIESTRMRDIEYIIGRTGWDYRISRILAPNSQYFIGEELLRESFYNCTWDNFYKGGKLIIFTTNSDNYYKGLETVFYCISLLLKTKIDVEWRIAGVKDDSLVVSISKSFLGDNFPKTGYKLLGSLDEEGLVSELLSSHLYIMPSHIENSPNNLCEAMILGMPCIATFAGGTGSLLKDGEEGILIQDGDPWVMAGAIIELMQDQVKVKEFTKNARRRALLRHDITNVTSQYLTIYKRILKNKVSEN